MNKYPRGVRIILGFYSISLAFVFFSFVSIATGILPLSPAAQAQLAALGPIDDAITTLSFTLSLLGTLMLYRLKRLSIVLYGTELLLGILYTGYQIYQGTASNPISDCFAYALTLGILYYLYTLSKKGVLT